MTFKTTILLVAVAALVGCGRGARETAQPRPDADAGTPADAQVEADADTVTVDHGMLRDLRVTTRPVESRPDGEQITLLGELAVDQRAYAEVGVPMSARVTRVLVSSGDTVRQGQALIELTSTELGRARAEFLSAQTRVTLAEAALDRKRSLAAERIAPLREVQDAELAMAETRAALRSVRASIEAFGVSPPAEDGSATTSSTFTLRSPIAGAVIERVAVVGQMLDPSTPAFRIGDLSHLWLNVHAFERDAVRVTPGAAARITFAALPGQGFPGAVAVIGRQVDRESRTVPIRIDVRNDDQRLRPGMSAVASVPASSAGAAILTVPVAAVQRVRNEWCVFLPKREGAFEIRRIGRGRDLGGEVEVLSGLRAGEAVVVDGAFLLKAQAEKGETDHDEHGGKQ